MITFKQFLNEREERKSRTEDIPVDSAIRWMENYSEDYLRNGRLIYRGLRASDGLLFGTTLGGRERTSAHTQNFYTLWMDNHPDFDHLPKRGRSFICSTNDDYASGYGQLYVVVPKDNAVIGTIGEEDLWGVHVWPKMNMEEFNSITSWAINFVGEELPHTWNDEVKTFRAVTQERIRERVENDLGDVSREATVMLQMMEKKGCDDLFEVWEKYFLPGYFDATTPDELGPRDMGEVWIQEDCIFIPIEGTRLSPEEKQNLMEFAEQFPALHAVLRDGWSYDDDEVEKSIDPDKLSDEDRLDARRKQRG